MPFAQYGSNGRTSKWGSSSTSIVSQENPYDIEKLQKQIENAKLRAQDAGFDPEPDRRNWFEKLTNLPEGQNALFDALELINRPGQAIMNVLDKATKGERGVAEAAWRGFSGKDRVYGSEFLKERGVDNKVAQIVFGTGLDIITDPLNLLPAGAIAKGVKAAANPIGRGFSKFANVVEEAIPTVKQVRTEAIQPALEKVKDTAGRIFVPQYKWDETLTGKTDDTLKRLYNDTENRIRFMNEEALKNVADTAKAAGGIETGTMVGRVMEKDLRQFEDIKAFEFPDGLRRTENKADLYKAIDENRGKIKDLGREINFKKREYQSAISEFADGLNKTDNEIRKLYMSLERQAGKDFDKMTRQNLREAGRELARVESQLSNFGKNEESLLRYFKKQIRNEHEMNFDIIKKVRQTSPNGITTAAGVELPPSLRSHVRKGGKGLDEVADELGYSSEAALLRDIQVLNGVPRRLDNATIEKLAREEMEMSGALKALEASRKELEEFRDTIRSSIEDIQKTASTNAPVRASEKAFAELSKDPKYLELKQQRDAIKQSLDALKSDSRLSKQSRIDEIKRIENEINALRDSARNPVIIQREIERPIREMPSDPKVKTAANNLMESNQMIREWALENGVDVSELEGYMTHILSAEERKLRSRRVNIDSGNAGIGQPKKAILNSRKLTGSVEDINERIGRTFFEPNAYFATAIGQKRLIEYVNAAKFRKDILNNPNFARKYKSGMDIPNNAVIINTNNYKFLKNPLDAVGEFEEIGGEYVVTKGVKEALDRYQTLTTNEGVRGFLKAFDATTTTWKKFALFSPGYHMRNAIGALFNNYVGGMNIADLAKYTASGTDEVVQALMGKESKLFQEYRRQGLSSSALSQIEFRPYGEPEKAIMRTIQERSKDTKGKIFTRLKPQRMFETSKEAGDFIDQTNRFALYKWAREKKGMTPEQAAAKVREIQFDYTRTTATEREIFTRMIPFYRWMRNNIPFQLRQFVHDPAKYSNVNKIRLNAMNTFGIEQENTPQWMKEQFAMPVSEDKFLSLGLPMGDLTKLSEPLKMAVDGINPLLKTPIELATNYNMFYQKPIERFEGQTKQFVGGLDIPIKTAYALEQLTGQVGRGFSQYLQKEESVDQDTKFRMPRLGINSIVKEYDREKSEYFELYNQLQQYLDYLKYIEQQTGQKPRSVNEIR